MNLLGAGALIKTVGQVADDLITSKEEKLQLELQSKAMDVSLMQGQMEVNKVEAAHKSVFVAGWRPFIGWVGGLALAYQFLLYPLLVWAWALLQANDIIPCHINADAMTALAENAKAIAGSVQAMNLGQCTFEPPPTFDSSELFAIITGMLGIGGMRSFDKFQGTQTDVVDPEAKAKKQAQKEERKQTRLNRIRKR